MRLIGRYETDSEIYIVICFCHVILSFTKLAKFQHFYPEDGDGRFFHTKPNGVTAQEDDSLNFNTSSHSKHVLDTSAFQILLRIRGLQCYY
jgi:hypothetical protein